MAAPADPFYVSYGVKGPPTDRDDIMRIIYEDVPAFRREKDHVDVAVPNIVQQMDLLMLSNDAGYRYALVVVDLASRALDAVPLKTKLGKHVVVALNLIYARARADDPLALKPPRRLECDEGPEFKNAEVQAWARERNVFLRYGRPGRHRQQSLAERLNGVIGKALYTRQVAAELLRGHTVRGWVQDLPTIVEAANERWRRTPAELAAIYESNRNAPPGSSEELLELGDKVHVRLDRPHDTAGDPLKPQTWRAGDYKFEIATRTVKSVILNPGHPARYIVSGIPQTSFARWELKKERPGEHAPDGAALRPDDSDEEDPSGVIGGGAPYADDDDDYEPSDD